MSKIYIVTAGEYSDYGIEAVFTEKDMAEKYAETISERYHQAGVEEWELNPHEDDLRNDRKPFFVRITEAGDVTEVRQGRSYSSEVGFDVDNNMYTTAWANDENHARKIAAERHAVVKSNGWPEKKQR